MGMASAGLLFVLLALFTHSRGEGAYAAGTYFLDPSCFAGGDLPEYKIPFGDVPGEYDWRDDVCAFDVFEQGACRADWAFATVYMNTARWCKASGDLAVLSAQEHCECDHIKAHGVRNSGCSGGHYLSALKYTQRVGSTTAACAPYTYGNITADGSAVGECSATCVGSTTPKPRYQTEPPYRVRTANEIKRDIYEYGPILAQMKVYSDLYEHGEGIYTVGADATYKGGHSVNIVGWGEDEGVAYWIVANTWGPDWGQGGYFRIRMGTNEAGIESLVVGALPDTEADDCRATVLYPEPQQLALVGSLLPIRWEMLGVTGGNATIRLEIHASNETVGIVAVNVPNTGSYDWQIPDSFAPADCMYQLYITITSESTSVIAASAPFNIQTKDASISITSPPPGEEVTWQVGSNVKVQYETSCDKCRVALRLLSTGGNATLLCTEYNRAKGFISVNIPEDFPVFDSLYTAELSLLGEGAPVATHEKIHIIAAQSASITLAAPSAPVKVLRGDAVTIDWDVFGVDELAVSLILHQRPRMKTQQTLGTFTKTQYTWTVPDTLDTGAYVITLIPADISGVTHVSTPEIVVVDDLEDPSVDVQYPQQRDRWKCDNVYNITWNSHKVPSVNISFFRGNSLIQKVAEDTPNCGSFLFKPKCSAIKDIAGADDFYFIVSSAYDSVYSVSQQFVIEASDAEQDCAMTTIVSPDAASMWAIGAAVHVRVQTFGLSHDDLSFVLLDSSGKAAATLEGTMSSASATLADFATRIPTDIAQGEYRILVRYDGALTCFPDELTSDAFKVVPAPSAALEMYEPANNTVCRQLEPCEVKWLTVLEPPRELTLELWAHGKYQATLLDGFMSDELRVEFILDTSFKVTGTTRLRVRTKDKPYEYTDSLLLTVKEADPMPDIPPELPAPAPVHNNTEPSDYPLAIVKPNSDSVWIGGEAATVSWTSSVSDKYPSVSMILFRGPYMVGYLERRTPNAAATEKTITVPTSTPSGTNFMLLIRTDQYPVVSNRSEVFSIVQTSTAPLAPAESMRVTWRRRSVLGDMVTLHLFTDDEYVGPIVTTLPNSGEYTWEVPPLLNVDGRALRFEVCAHSQNFHMINCVAGSVSTAHDSFDFPRKSFLPWITLVLLVAVTFFVL
eukprot:gnl/Chilomastix_cuspidata/3184.p1 GENE.gnl/Chilomastix_cuspidata/3184~~gnl/Chilomastix_cuspidata/3184.p1  ORF type:complete len:1132 (-),score=342.42 gnl/Chilomastix_cuspidata/3184:547-3942(-)